MITELEWHEFLYSCDLEGQLWLHVNRVGWAYVSWRMGMATTPFGPQSEAQKMLDAFAANPAKADQRLAEFLAEPHYGAKADLSAVSEKNKEKIIRMLRLIVSEKPNPEWVN